MSRKYKGAQQALSELVERSIIYTACLPHGSNLAIEHGSNASRTLATSTTLWKLCMCFFSASAKGNSVLNKKLNDAESLLPEEYDVDALMMLNCERHIVDAIDIQHVVDRWANVRKHLKSDFGII